MEVAAGQRIAAARGRELRGHRVGRAHREPGRVTAPLATFRKVIDINLIGTFNLMRIGAAAVAAPSRSMPTASAA